MSYKSLLPRRLTVTIDYLAIVPDPRLNDGTPFCEIVTDTVPMLLESPGGKHSLSEAFSVIAAELVNKGHVKAYSVHFTVFGPRNSVMWQGYVTQYGPVTQDSPAIRRDHRRTAWVDQYKPLGLTLN
jgi:hypothetical protein